MSAPVLHVTLAVVWVLLYGDPSPETLAAGLVMGLAAMSFVRPSPERRRYVAALVGCAHLFEGFTRELFAASVQLARDLLSPSPHFQPGFVRFDIPDLGPAQTVMLANLVSLTPGTITVDVDDDATTLYVHSIYAHDPDEVRRAVYRMADLVHRATGRGPLSARADGGDETWRW